MGLCSIYSSVKVIRVMMLSPCVCSFLLVSFTFPSVRSWHLVLQPREAGMNPPYVSMVGRPVDILGLARQIRSNVPIMKGNLSNRVLRSFDVPMVECPPGINGVDKLPCPTPDRSGRYRCVEDHVLCDGFVDCPNAEDEDRTSCMFHRSTSIHLDVLADALFRWSRRRE